MKKVIIYPGRFQPMLPHHAQVFRSLQANNPDVRVFIATSDKVDPPRSPFGFDEKVSIMKNALGIPEESVLRVKSPYNNREYEQHFDAENTQLIFAVGEKDMQEDPRFSFPETGLDIKVKTGEPKYLQSINTVNMGILPMSQRGYVMIAPTVTVNGETASATKFRNAMMNARDLEHAKQVYTQYFGEFNHSAFHTIYKKISEVTMKNQINEMRMLAGLPPIMESQRLPDNAHSALKVFYSDDVASGTAEEFGLPSEMPADEQIESLGIQFQEGEGPGEWQLTMPDGRTVTVLLAGYQDWDGSVREFSEIVEGVSEAAPVDFSRKSIYTDDSSLADLGRLLMQMGEEETLDLELANTLSELGGDLVQGQIKSGKDLTDFVKNSRADQQALLQKISNALDAYNRGERANAESGEPEPEDTRESALSELRRLAGLPVSEDYGDDMPGGPADPGWARQAGSEARQEAAVKQFDQLKAAVMRGSPDGNPTPAHKKLVDIIDEFYGLSQFMDEHRDEILDVIESDRI